jgi:tripartite-type tricarboxylate transporter receptor subunit TctC
MKFSRRNLLRLATGAVALPALSRIAKAQTYPTRSVRIVVGWPAGGVADIVARIMGQWLSERLDQPFLIENRPGASGNIGTEAVVRTPPDGYTLLVVSIVDAINATLYDRLNFNFIRDITPVASFIRVPNVMVVNPSVPVTSVPEFIAYARANPGKLNMGSGGVGTPHHISGELFKMMTGVNLLHVPYRGGAPAVTDLLGGQLQVIFDPMPESIEHIRAGKLRALAVTTVERSESLPDVPAVADFVPGYDTSTWLGLGLPRKTPIEIVSKAQQRDQRGPCRSQDQGAVCGIGWHGAPGLACRLPQAGRRRNREVGQGDPGGPNQGGMSLPCQRRRQPQ